MSVLLLRLVMSPPMMMVSPSLTGTEVSALRGVKVGGSHAAPMEMLDTPRAEIRGHIHVTKPSGLMMGVTCSSSASW